MQEDALCDVPQPCQGVPGAVTASTRVIVMDKPPFKKTASVEAAIEAVGACVCWLLLKNNVAPGNRKIDFPNTFLRQKNNNAPTGEKIIHLTIIRSRG